MVFGPLFCTIIIFIAVATASVSNPDWTHFLIDNEVPQFSIETFRSLPLEVFYDVLQKKHRMGIIGDKVDPIIDIVEEISHKVEINGNFVHIKANITEISKLMYYSIGVLQSTLPVLESLEKKIYGQGDISRSLLSNVYNISEIAKTIGSKKQVIAEKDIKLLTLQALTDYLKKEKLRFDSLEARVNYRINERKKLRDIKNTTITEMTKEKARNLLQIEEDYQRSMNELTQKEFDLETQQEISFLNELHNLTISHVKIELENFIKNLEFRVEEEQRLRVQRDAEQLSMMEAKSKYTLEQRIEVIHSIINEFDSKIQLIVNNPKYFLSFGAVIMAVVLIIVTITEIANLVEEISRRKTNRQRIMKINTYKGFSIISLMYRTLRKPWVLDGDRIRYFVDHVEDRKHFSLKDSNHSNEQTTNNENTELQTLIGHQITIALPPTQTSSIVSLLGVLESRCQVLKVGALPNVLICGPPGSGKSFLSLFLSSACGLSYAVVTSGDLSSLGRHRAAEQLKFLIHDLKHRNKRPSVLVIDGADDIITERGHHDHSAREMFFVLLDELRDSSDKVAVILTSTIDRDQVDSAVIDRLDYVIQLPLPTLLQRYELALLKSCELLQGSISSRCVSQMQQELRYFNADKGELHRIEAKLKRLHTKCQSIFHGSNTRRKQTQSSINAIITLLRKYFESSLSHFDSVCGEHDADNMHSNDSDQSFHGSIVHANALLAAVSDDWSVRDIVKFLNTLRSMALSCDNCQVSETLWKEQLVITIQSRLKIFKQT